MNLLNRFSIAVFLILLVVLQCVDSAEPDRLKYTDDGTFDFRIKANLSIVDPIRNNGVERDGKHFAVFFVWQPEIGVCGNWQIAYFPYDVFEIGDDSKFSDENTQSREEKKYYDFYFLYFLPQQNNKGILSYVKVISNDLISTSISKKLLKERNAQYDHSHMSYDSSQRFASSMRPPIKVEKDKELENFFNTLNTLTANIFDKIKKINNDKKLEDCSFSIYIYGNDVTDYKLLIFDNKESNDWIGDNQIGKVGWIGDPKTSKCCEFYCTDPKEFQDDDKRKKLLEISVEVEESFVACDKKVASLIGLDIKINGDDKSWSDWKDYYTCKGKYAGIDGAFLLKKEFNNDIVGKLIAIALARSDEDYWSTHFRQNPLVPYNLLSK